MRENILFGKCYDPKRYRKVIDSCALTPDLEVLAAGDKTQIGERVCMATKVFLMPATQVNLRPFHPFLDIPFNTICANCHLYLK